MCDIQHPIDTVPGASVLSTYRISRQEHEILKEKVEELFQKGHI